MTETISAEFTQPRMQRCFDLFATLRAVQEGKSNGRCRVVTEAPVQGKSLEEFAHQTFSVGVDDDLAELPFIDLLIIFQMLTHFEQNRHIADADRKTFVFPTEFRTDSALKILAHIEETIGFEIR